MTLEERRIILTGINNNSTKSAIARIIGKDKSTVGKEIKRLGRDLFRKYVHVLLPAYAEEKTMPNSA